MSILYQRTAKPPASNSTKSVNKDVHPKWPYQYDHCPSCGEWKAKGYPLCRKCKAYASKPPVIDDIFIIEGERCRKIPLTQKQYAIVDECKYEMLMRFATWHAQKNRKGKYYAVAKRNGVHISMHFLSLATPNGLQCDHKNNNPLDNRLSNLRPSTQQQNNRNKGIQNNNSTGCKGVFPLPPWGYRVGIRVDKKMIWLGTYPTIREGGLVYDKAAREYFGEFAWLNFPNDSQNTTS